MKLWFHSIGYFSAGYRIVIICSNEEEDTSYFISKLHLYRRPFVFQTSAKELEDYLLDHFTKQVQKAKKPSYDLTNMASVVDSLKYDIALPCMLYASVIMIVL